MAFRSMALVFAVAGGLAACGQPSPQAPQESSAPQSLTQASPWASLAADVTVSPQPDGSVVIAASNTAPGYQVDYTVATNGAAAIRLRYDITLQGGPGFIGVLAGDGSRWLNNFDLPANQRSQGDALVPLSGDAVRIVIQTGPTSARDSRFTVHSVEYALQ